MHLRHRYKWSSVMLCCHSSSFHSILIQFIIFLPFSRYDSQQTVGWKQEVNRFWKVVSIRYSCSHDICFCGKPVERKNRMVNRIVWYLLKSRILFLNEPSHRFSEDTNMQLVEKYSAICVQMKIDGIDNFIVVQIWHCFFHNLLYYWWTYDNFCVRKN